MKASELLIEQHEEVREMFKELITEGGRSKAKVEKLADSLAAHMAIEQELFYPAVMKVKADMVLEGYEEHAVARFALKRLWDTVLTDQTFEAKVVTLQEIIEHHADEEEEELFPKAEKALGDRSEVLGAEMKALYLATMDEGYVHAVGRGGSAVTTSRAPSLQASP